MSVLFEEMTLGSLRAKNRFVRAATYEGLATTDGHITSALVAICEELAAGGVGTIVMGYAHITAEEQPNPRMLGMYDDSFVAEYRDLTDHVHVSGAKIVSQIVYGGSASRLTPPSARIFGPSAVPHPKTGIVPIEAAISDIEGLIDAFAAAAVRAHAAGFDGVELHAAHGYLLSQFLSPLLNHRTDRYGGSIENRSRIIVEAVDEIRRRVGADFPLLVKLNSSDGVRGGLSENDSLAAARCLAQHGVDAIEVSGAWRACKLREFSGEPFFASYAKRLVNEIGVPVILTGGNRSFEVMERLRVEDGITGFGLCRPLICEPCLVNRWMYDASVVPRCTSCDKCSSTPGHRCILPQCSFSVA
ncbi:MAG: NADH:flavin oxidoreductase [Gordonibacter sp.]|nr:NADH:flavin oxidoreductase [Gordonibacter sp.]